MDIARRVGAALLIVAALGVWFGMAPHTGQYSDDIKSALSDATVNEATADSAPQQQVVNGWAAKDLLAIIAREQAESDQRQTALTGLLIVGVGLALVTVRPRTGIAPTTQTPIIPDQPTGAELPPPAAAGRHGTAEHDAPAPATP
jgi:hypothetical protein